LAIDSELLRKLIGRQVVRHLTSLRLTAENAPHFPRS
jgi:hypothetical protein